MVHGVDTILIARCGGQRKCMMRESLSGHCGDRGVVNDSFPCSPGFGSSMFGKSQSFVVDLRVCMKKSSTGELIDDHIVTEGANTILDRVRPLLCDRIVAAWIFSAAGFHAKFAQL